MFGGVTGLINRGQKLKGTIVLMQKNLLDINELTAAQSPAGIAGGAFDFISGAAGAAVDTLTSVIGRSVALKLISATSADGNFFFFKEFFSFTTHHTFHYIMMMLYMSVK